MSVEIEFKLTSIGKTDIANLLAGETLEVKKVYITDAQSGDNESYVSGLSGNIVFQGDVQGEILYEKDEVLYTKDEWDATMPSGTIPDTGLLHVEFFDDSENYYGGKTIAITYTKELEERILCIATGETASDELVVKHFSPLSLSLDLRFESAENISFENINLSFPPATEGRRGSVKLASSADVMAGTGSGVVTSQNLNTKLGNYVTLDTQQTITGEKTFTNRVRCSNLIRLDNSSDTCRSEIYHHVYNTANSLELEITDNSNDDDYVRVRLTEDNGMPYFEVHLYTSNSDDAGLIFRSDATEGNWSLLPTNINPGTMLGNENFPFNNIYTENINAQGVYCVEGLFPHPLLQAGSSNIETPVGSIVWLSVQINDGSTPPNDKIGTQIISSNNTACYAGNIGTSGTIQQYTNGYVFVALQSILWETIDNKPTASFLAMRIS